MKKIFAVVLMLAMVLSVFAACGAETTKAPATETPTTEGTADVQPVKTYAEFIAAADDTSVQITAYVQLKSAYSEEYRSTNVFLADKEGGAYYAYSMNCSPEQYSALHAGQKITVSGFKITWGGEPEIAQGCTFEPVMGGDAYIAPSTDVTALFGTPDLESKINSLVKVSDITVVASTIESSDQEFAFLYNWNGMGSEGDDIYFNVSIGGTVYQFMIESSEFGADTDVYKAAQTLKIGDQITVEGFMYWYSDAPNPHISSITVAPAPGNI